MYCGWIVVPVNQRHDILEKLHESQQGLHNCRQRAQRAVWWAGLSRDLEQFIDGCRECRKHRPNQRIEPLHTSVLPGRPLQKLGADLLSFDGKDYTVVADYYSTWLEIVRLHNTTAAAVISKLQHIFAAHGISDTVISDNGPQLQCKEFRDFAHEFELPASNKQSSFPTANGLAESRVKIATKILRQASPVVALLSY